MDQKEDRQQQQQQRKILVYICKLQLYSSPATCRPLRIACTTTVCAPYLAYSPVHHYPIDVIVWPSVFVVVVFFRCCCCCWPRIDNNSLFFWSMHVFFFFFYFYSGTNNACGVRAKEKSSHIIRTHQPNNNNRWLIHIFTMNITCNVSCSTMAACMDMRIAIIFHPNHVDMRMYACCICLDANCFFFLLLFVCCFHENKIKQHMWDTNRRPIYTYLCIILVLN